MMRGAGPVNTNTSHTSRRTLLSLLPPAHPPLSTKHRAHILSAEFAKCASYVGQGSTNHIAAGYELIEVCREGGREWDVERGRVMVAMATADRWVFQMLSSYLPPSLSLSLSLSLS